MNKYLAIGHFKFNKNATVCVAFQQNTMKDFRNDLVGNEFVAYVILSEKKLESLKSVDSFVLFEEVKKMTTNYHRWKIVCEFIDQCYDIMQEKMADAE